MAAALTIPTPAAAAAVADPAWDQVSWLPCQLSVEIPVSHFTLGDLLSLKVNSVVDTKTASNADVPISVNGARIGFAKFDDTQGRVAVRLSELT